MVRGTKRTLKWIIYLPILAMDDVSVKALLDIVAFSDNFLSVFDIFNHFSSKKSVHNTNDLTWVG